MGEAFTLSDYRIDSLHQVVRKSEYLTVQLVRHALSSNDQRSEEKVQYNPDTVARYHR